MKCFNTIFKIIILYSLLFAAVMPGFAYDLPDMGDSTIHSFSRGAEEQLGAEIMRSVRSSRLYNNDPIVTDYVRQMGDRITASSDYAMDSFYFFVINDPRVNAFALPGGYIGINAGLILVAEYEDEVAGVMAHEIAHVTQRHIARMFERSKSLSWPMMAALLGSMILATASPAAGTSAMAATLAGSQQDMINFTRSNEEEADRIGMDMLVKAGYDPNGMSTFFARMAQANKYNDSFYVPEFLRTHPINSSRIADAATRAQSYKVPLRKDSLSFELIKQRLNVLFADHTRNILAYYQAEIEKPAQRNDPAWRYGYSLALASKGQFPQAQQELQQLIKNDADEKIYRMSLAQVYEAQHQYMQAISLLQETLQLYPNDESLTLQTAQTMVNAEQYNQAKVLLEKQLRKTQDNPHLYNLLAKTQSELNNPQASYIARAEYYALQDDLHSAVRELKRAQAENKDNAYQQAKIAARLAELEADLELREKK